MNKSEQMRLCLMLAFQTVIMHGESAKSEAAVQKIIGLAKLMNEFCDLHVLQYVSEHSQAEVSQEVLRLLKKADNTSMGGA